MKRAVVTSGLLLGLLVLSIGAGVALGSERIPLSSVYRVLGGRLGFADAPELTTSLIVWNLRLPRVILAIIVGGGLSVMGVIMQTLVRNPLAEPYILGISSGASAGVSLFYLGLLPPLLAEVLTIPLAAFLGGLISINIVYLVARSRQGLSVARLLLAGVAMSALMGALSSFITFASPNPDKLRTVLFLLMGSLSGTRWDMLVLPSVVTLSTTILLIGLARPLDALLVGEEPAHSLGVPVEMVKRILIGIAALVTGTLVAVSGTIGFVGLIVPHAVRSLVGVTHRRLLPVSFIAGGLFLLWADLAARLLLPAQELPVGILTALCGVPFFLVLLRRRAYQFG